MKMIDHNHFICHLILGTFTEYPCLTSFRDKRTELALKFLFVYINVNFLKPPY